MQKINKGKFPNQLIILYCLFFFSGISALIFQIAWMYHLGLIFGNTSYATATTLAAFFIGIGIGGWYWGKKSVKINQPLLAYGFIEIGIATTALLLLPAIDIYKNHYNLMVYFTGGNQQWLVLLKFIFSVILLIIPTTLMGGTFPILAKYVGNRRNKLEKRGTILYAVNTIGAAIGAFVTGFYLIERYGMKITYTLAVIMSIAVGILAIISHLKNRKNPSKVQGESIFNEELVDADSSVQRIHLSKKQFILLAFSSGLLALSLEMLWSRMFAQVLQNSVYSFSAVLVVFLMSLGFGGFISNRLIKTTYSPKKILYVLLILSALAVGISPILFNFYTDGLEYIAPHASWPVYLVEIFKFSSLIILIPATVLGAIFPFLLKAAPLNYKEPGRFAGNLILYNSLGSVVGPPLVGFLMLDLFGLWASIKLIAIFYAVLGILISSSLNFKKRNQWSFFSLLIIGVIILTKDPTVVHLSKDEKLLDYWNSNNGVVSITKSNNNLQMRLDNYYTLGDSESLLVEQMQAHIPLFLHPSPDKVLFLGMGTGITAGAALDHNVDKIVAVELLGNIVIAAKKYFSSWTNELFTDDRVDIITDDARNYVIGTNDKYDVIVGDLFTPWHAGTGSLYTVEHFKRVKSTLTEGGLFAQWLPLYQLTPEDFNIIAATFSSVFPHVTVWRADFNNTRPSIALIGHGLNTKLNQKTLEQNISRVFKDNNGKTGNEHMVGLFYMGNLIALENNLRKINLNTDDKRLIEFRTPILSQQSQANQGKYLIGRELEKLTYKLTSSIPADKDPYLSELPKSEVKYVKVGFLYSRYLELLSGGQKNKAIEVRKKIEELDPSFLKL